MVDRVHYRELIDLNLASAHQIARLEVGDHHVGLPDRTVEGGPKVSGRQGFAAGELRVPVSVSRCTANTTNDPLANVAGQVQNQVADRVLGFMLPRPDLLVVQPFEAGLDTSPVLLELSPAEEEELRGNSVRGRGRPVARHSQSSRTTEYSPPPPQASMVPPECPPLQVERTIRLSATMPHGTNEVESTVW